MKFSKPVNVQLNGTVSLIGAKDLTDAQKRVLLGKTISITVDGHTVTGTIRFSKSDGLTATIATKLLCHELGEAVVVEKESAFNALAEAANGALTPKAEAALDKAIGLSDN